MSDEILAEMQREFIEAIEAELIKGFAVPGVPFVPVVCAAPIAQMPDFEREYRPEIRCAWGNIL